MSFKNKKAAVMKVLEKYDLDSSALWDCHGTPVILHKALERVADREKITFDAPQILETNADKRIAVVCVTGRKGDLSAWSFGEAMPSNNKNAYPFAMAEKRAKDRVILKLIGLSGDVYSEEEADDFKNSNPAKPANKEHTDLGPRPLEMRDFINLPEGIKEKSAYACNKDGDFTRLCEIADMDIAERRQVPAWVQEYGKDIAAMPLSFRHSLKEHIEGRLELIEKAKKEVA